MFFQYKCLVVVVLLVSLLVSGCGTIFSQNEDAIRIQELPSEIADDVANLPILDMSSVDSFEKYSHFVDFTNNLSDILNKKSDGTFNIPEIEATRESYNKASRFITEYSPLIDNYNDVVEIAKQVSEGESEITEFYKASAIFGLEVAVIFTGLYHPISYKTVGTLYRAVGLNRFAFDCPSCISPESVKV